MTFSPESPFSPATRETKIGSKTSSGESAVTATIRNLFKDRSDSPQGEALVKACRETCQNQCEEKISSTTIMKVQTTTEAPTASSIQLPPELTQDQFDADRAKWHACLTGDEAEILLGGRSWNYVWELANKISDNLSKTPETLLFMERSLNLFSQNIKDLQSGGRALERQGFSWEEKNLDQCLRDIQKYKDDGDARLERLNQEKIATYVRNAKKLMLLMNGRYPFESILMQMESVIFDVLNLDFIQREGEKELYRAKDHVKKGLAFKTMCREMTIRSEESEDPEEWILNNLGILP